ncbi:hypothetical protein TNIN_488321 [Trichonephila inaurata madagascariensis]|uniref:Uncharacterized protein n=1 Tax=Trichonephila inaurata madagascariensis TaxID=2747483 RepID=A0A8X6X2P8_9ARAC|nr:hypothetical protein TNIN_488321 [Trichonephila inaurata madagascariensis]
MNSRMRKARDSRDERGEAGTRGGCAGAAPALVALYAASLQRNGETIGSISGFPEKSFARIVINAELSLFARKSKSSFPFVMRATREVFLWCRAVVLRIWRRDARSLRGARLAGCAFTAGICGCATRR